MHCNTFNVTSHGGARCISRSLLLEPEKGDKSDFVISLFTMMQTVDCATVMMM